MCEKMIACHDITFRYPGAETPLFDGLDVTIDKPGFHALFGPSGIGKTTLAKIISGNIDSFSGRVKAIGDMRCLYTYNRERLPGWSPVGRHLEKTTPPGRRLLRDELIHHFGLIKLMDMRYSQLSMGQCNRVNLLRYLLQDFSILIMDESLANVDEPTRQAILYKIKSIFPEAGFLYISHNVVEVARFCDQIVVFRGAHQSPQTCCISGQDHREDQPLDKTDLERSMLEIMNAA
ncbi:ABC transporter ATP-binding protein [Desulfosarcina sp.]|uniref:ATP-binding cassette domain-containing protein n=1 Tax=Desulfosarcina sp. TaxID=2027861 RepID=UPI0029B9C127|nr:ATP-binding cassette domain-containing protein [Desulfosarcina sp.]MDX2452521.1 ATP-binding cassette domain-containing protein [Desulfosarcina sp.]MDX2490295.1 ATP-binding cassette domain-containing protein [Desulfosarcina sp.]